MVVLAAIWGASFLFMRIAVPQFGPVLLMALRVLLAAMLLAGMAVWLRQALRVREHGRHYLILGVLNSALPFVLFGYAAQTLSASLLSILNATAPLFGAVIGALWLRQRPGLKVGAGLLLGIAGVATLVGFGPTAAKPGSGLAVLAAMGAAASYGVASVYLKRFSAGLSSFAVAHGSMWAASFVLIPWVAAFPPTQAPDAPAWSAVAALGLVCTGMAYLMYFRLVQDAGPTRALTVTFLIPVFGVLWGHLLLGEAVGWNTLSGAVVVLLGTAMATGFSPAVLWSRRRLRTP
jgi:drug/metabolite transporter (DMT)-like permease